MAIDTTVTLKRLIAEFSEWSTAHPMVNDFGYGQYLEKYRSGENKYLALIVNSPSATSQDFFINYQWEIICLDFVLDEKANRDQVNSDTMNVLRDLENTVRYSKRWKEFSRADSDWSYRKVDEFGADKCFGWIATLTLKVKKKHGICDIKSLMPTYDFEMGQVVYPACDPVTFLINGVDEDSFASGDEFDLTVVNQLGATPIYSYDDVLKKLTVQTGGGGSIDISINAVLVYDDQTTDVDISVVGSDDLPKGAWDGTKQVISDSPINHNGDLLSPLPSELTKFIATVDSEGNPISVVTVDTPTILLLTTPDATNTYQGSPILGVLAQGSKAITSAYANGTPVGTLTTDTKSALHIEIPNPVTYPIAYVRPIATKTTSYLLYDEASLKGLGVYPLNSLGIAPRLTDFWNLHASTPNAMGSLKRFTGTTGGYQNEIDFLFYDINNVLTTEALAFPNDYVICHYSGLGRSRQKYGINKRLSVELPIVTDPSFSWAGFTGSWRIPMRTENDNFLNFAVEIYIFATAPVPFTNITSNVLMSNSTNSLTTYTALSGGAGGIITNANAAFTNADLCPVRTHYL